MSTTLREERQGEVDAGRAELVELRNLLETRKRELWAAAGNVSNRESLATADPDELTAQLARKLALERIVDAIVARIAEVEALQQMRDERLRTVTLRAKNLARYIEQIERDLAPGGRFDLAAREAEAAVAAAARAREQGERELATAQADLGRLWGASPLPE